MLAFLLSACGATPNNITNANRSSLSPDIDANSPSDWPLALETFKNASASNVQEPYLGLVNRINTWPENDYCSDDFNKAVSAMLKLNPTSILGYYALSQCATLAQNEELSQYAQNQIADIVPHLIQGKTGDSYTNAIPVRETAEANTIFQLSGISVLDFEAVHFEGKLYFKYHCYDESTGRFSYRYTQSYHFFSSYFTQLAGEYMDEKQSSNMLTRILQANNSYAVMIGYARNHLIRHQYLKAKQQLLKSQENRALKSILLALVYMHTNNDEALEALLNDIISFSDEGLAEATAFIAHFIFVRDTNNQQTESVLEQLAKVDSLTSEGTGVKLLAEMLSVSQNYESQLRRFMSEYDSPTAREALRQYYLELNRKSVGRRFFNNAKSSTLKIMKEFPI